MVGFASLRDVRTRLWHQADNRHDRFRDSDISRQIFEVVVRDCMTAGLVKDDGAAVDASVIEANASCYRGKATDEIECRCGNIRRGQPRKSLQGETPMSIASRQR